MYPILWTFLFLCAALVIAILEVFLPSGGIFGVLAAGCLVTSIVFSFKINVLVGSLYTLFVSLLVPIFLWTALRLWPHTWFGQRILLEPNKDPALAPNEVLLSFQQLVGKQGIAKSKMLLGGLIEIEGQQYNAVSDADSIESGEPLRVVRIEGTSIMVRKINLSKVPAISDVPPSIDDPFAAEGN